MNILTVPTLLRYILSPTSDKCTYCKQLWIKVSVPNALNVNVNGNVMFVWTCETSSVTARVLFRSKVCIWPSSCSAQFITDASRGDLCGHGSAKYPRMHFVTTTGNDGGETTTVSYSSACFFFFHIYLCLMSYFVIRPQQYPSMPFSSHWLWPGCVIYHILLYWVKISKVLPRAAQMVTSSTTLLL